MNSDNKSLPKIALISVHGVGTHLPLSTLASTAAFVRQAIKYQTKHEATLVAAQRNFGQNQTVKDTPCISLEYPSTTEQPHRIDLFEGYYSPVPKGKTDLKELMGFLLLTGVQAIGRKQIYRSINHKLSSFKIDSGTKSFLWAMIASIVGVIAINVLFTAQIASFIAEPKSLNSSASLGQAILTLLFGFNIAYLVLVGLSFVLAIKAQKQSTSAFADRLFKGFPLFLLFTFILSGLAYFIPIPQFIVSFISAALILGRSAGLILAAFVLSAPIDFSPKQAPKSDPHPDKSELTEETQSHQKKSSRILPFAIVAILIGLAFALIPQLRQSLFDPSLRIYDFIFAGLSFVAISYAAKQYILNFAGDFAAYVLGARSSKFEEIRSEIKKRITTLLESLHQNYDHIIVVGHSLGSVVAYDALNHYLNNHETDAKTTFLITYGSPLDKFAFLFDSETAISDPIRHALVNSKQPMVNQSTRERTPWINIYNGLDPVSGRLDYYDIPTIPPQNPLATPSTGNVEKDFNDTYSKLNTAQPNILNINDTGNHIPLVSHSNYHKFPGLLAAIAFAVKETTDKQSHQLKLHSFTPDFTPETSPKQQGFVIDEGSPSKG